MPSQSTGKLLDSVMVIMPKIQGHILTDDVVVNYKNTDRDDCLHFLTHIDTSCHDLSSLISPTAKRIYTSIFNAWFLKINFDVKHIDVQGFEMNKSYKITFKGNKYIYSFIDSKFSTGSVALLLHGAFGAYLYTGNFCYYPSFVKSPVLLPVIEEKALTRLYLDNTYYEKSSNFLGFEEIASHVAQLINSEPRKYFYIHAEKITMDPLLIEIASRLKEKVYVCQSTMEIMKFLGFESFFTRISCETRIFHNKPLLKQTHSEQCITVYLNRFSDPCCKFQKIEKDGKVYNYHFYCHSNHKELCELLRILKPETMTFLFSEIDASKLSYKLDLNGFPQNVTLNGVSDKPSINLKGVSNEVVKNNHGQLILPNIIDNNSVGNSKDLGSKTIVISKNHNLLNPNINDGVKNLAAHVSSENQEVTHLHTPEPRCPLRIRKVPEINNTNKSNCTQENGVVECAQNFNLDNGINNNNSNVVDNSNKNASDNKPKPTKQSLKFIKLQDNNGNALIPCNIKSLSPRVVQTNKGLPVVFNPKLANENRLNGTNPKILQISKVGTVSNGKKSTIFVKRKYVDVNQPCIAVSPNNPQNAKQDDVENEKYLLTEKSIMLLKSKACDKNSQTKELPALNFSNAIHGSTVENSVSVSNYSFQISENRLGEPDGSTSSQSEVFRQSSVQLEASGNHTIDVNRDSDSSPNSIILQPENDIDQASETPDRFHLQGDQKTDNENNSDNSSFKTLAKSLVNIKAISRSPCKLTNHSDLEPLNKNSTKINETNFSKYNCQETKNDNSNLISKRCLSDDEDGQSRKKLRSDISIRQCLFESNTPQKDPFSLRNCSVLVKKNSFERSYFYSSQHDCYLPKFCGFKKHEVRPRHMLITLRNLHKLLK